MREAIAKAVQSLYVHVPFCAQKCSYCAFYSEASSGELINRYVEALVREMEMVAGDLRPRTVFFGGGTPSILNLKQWRQILGAMERLNLLGAEEWTVECNPATVSLDKAKLLKDFGVNRISMGVQSLNEDLLDRLGRVHSREMVFKSFDILRKAGFENLNLDLMFAIPGQTLQVWRETLKEALALESEHLSSYEVIYEEDTALYAQLQAGEFSVDEELACAMYDELLHQTARAGLEQYEIANFAPFDSILDQQNAVETRSPSPPGEGESFRSVLRNIPLADAGRSAAKRLKTATKGYLQFEPADGPPSPGGEGERLLSTIHNQQSTIALSPLSSPFSLPSRACLHNINYWRGGSFYGLGPSATSYVRGVRTKNYANTRLYCDHLARGERPVESSEELGPVARAGEIAAFGLRMPAGWRFEEFKSTTGFDLRQEWRREMKELHEKGWATISPERFHLTPTGLRFADAAAELFLR